MRINYPYDFQECVRNKYLSEDELNEMVSERVEEMIKYMEWHDVNNYSTTLEDVIIFVDKVDYEDSGFNYEISVGLKHMRMSI